MMQRILYSLIWCAMSSLLWAQAPLAFNKSRLLFEDNFAHPLDTMDWQVETMAHPANRVYTREKQLWMDTRDGVTVWYKRPLTGNYCIEYTRGFPADSGANNRLSDLNNFWQASDPNNPTLFTRKGVLAEYDSLSLYYAGIGGNSNSTSRFRKYPGNGERTLLQEYTDEAHLLHTDSMYGLTIVCKNGTTQFWVNGNLWFSYTDPQPLPAGYFGLRSTKSRQWVRGFRIWEIE
jgi:hypothetical protein